MNKNEHIENKVDEAIKAAAHIRNVEPPESIYAGVMDKIHSQDHAGTEGINYMQWAAIGLLVLVNAISYISFINSEDADLQTSQNTEMEIENLLSEYQINEFAYNEY